MLPIPLAQIKTWLRNETEEKHVKAWTNNEGCRQTKDAVPVATKTLARNLIRLNRDKIRKVVGILTGHCPLNKHLFTIGVTDSPLCRRCMEAEETPQHVLMESKSVADQRSGSSIASRGLPQSEKVANILRELGLVGVTS